MPETSRSKSLKGFLPKRAIVMAKRGAGKPASAKTAEVLGANIAAQASLLDGKNETLTGIAAELHDCTRCKLSKTRTKIVLGEGNPKAKIVFVGEGPGEQEDLSGRPFVGRAGQLLTKMIEAMGLKREDVFIANIVKCRPPDNRYPEPDETEACSPFVLRQLAAIQPQVVVALGKCATQSLLQQEVAITKIRGQFVDFRGTKLIPTFHPSYLLRNPPAKKEVWIDLQAVAKFIGHEIPKQRQEEART